MGVCRDRNPDFQDLSVYGAEDDANHGTFSDIFFGKEVLGTALGKVEPTSEQVLDQHLFGWITKPVFEMQILQIVAQADASFTVFGRILGKMHDPEFGIVYAEKKGDGLGKRTFRHGKYLHLVDIVKRQKCQSVSLGKDCLPGGLNRLFKLAIGIRDDDICLSSKSFFLVNFRCTSFKVFRISSAFLKPLEQAVLWGI